MFVRELVVRKGDRVYRYLRVVENVWQQNRTVQRILLNLGNVAHWPEGKLQEAIRLLSRFLQMDLTGLADIRFGDCRQLGPFLPLAQLWQDLDLDGILHQALAGRKVDLPVTAYAQAMVFNRLVDPRSKKAVWEAMAHDVQLPDIRAEDLPLHGYYRALEHLAAVQRPVEQALHRRLGHLFNRDLTLVFYDLTSTYFEGKACSRAKYGYSRDHRPDRVQIEIGLLVDGEGIPIGHEVYDGNVKDVETVLGALGRLQGDFQVKRCVFVGDEGMVSEENLAALDAAGYEYITSVSLRRSTIGLFLLENLPPRSTFQAVGENMRVRELGGDAKAAKVRYVASYNPERAPSTRRKRRERLRKCVAYLRQLQAGPRARGRRRAPETTGRMAEEFLRRKQCDSLIRVTSGAGGALTWRLDRDALRLEQRRDGLRILQTNSATLSPEEVAMGYRQLWRVEDAFRHLKDMVGLRPIRHWNDARVLGHVFVCVLAHTLGCLLEKRLRMAGLAMTARAALERLRPITVVSLELEGQRVRRRSEITPEQTQLLAAMGVKGVPELW